MDTKDSRSYNINPTFRLATETDLANIQSLTNWAITHTTANLDIRPNSLEQVQTWWNHHGPNYPVWIMEAEGNFAGWASISPFSSKIGYQRMVENSIYVAPAFHGKGFGSKCLDWIIQEAERLNYKQIIAKITAENKVSIKLHLRKGFVETGRLTEAAEKFNKVLDVVILQKKLGEA